MRIPRVILGSLLLVACMGAAGCHSQAVLGPQGQWSGPPRGLTSPSWSPDGKALVFLAQARPNDHTSNTWRINVDGTGLRQLTKKPIDSEHVVWSRDGKNIYYVAEDTYGAHIWRMGANGGPAVRVTGPRSDGDFQEFIEFALSRDGKQMIAVWSRPETGDQLALMSNGGVVKKLLTSCPHMVSCPSWLPDGRSFACVANCNIWKGIIANPKQFKQITFQPASESTTDEFGVSDLACSPTDGRFAFLISSRLWMMDSDTKRMHQVLNGDGSEYAPAWSPDGKQIAFVRMLAGVNKEEIWTAYADGTKPRRVTNFPDW